MKRTVVKILGCNVDTFTFDQALEHIFEIGGQVVTINPEMISNAQKDKNFSEIVNNAELIIPDGIGVEIGLKILGNNVRRIAGIEFGKALLKKGAEYNKRIALVGAKPEIIEKTVTNLRKEFKDINLVYTHDGYFDDDEVVKKEIIASNPDIVLVALGSPKQELFINNLKNDIPGSIFIGLGGSFDVWSGVVKRAPKVYQNLGLEWLYRTLAEPKRFKRIFPALPLFVLAVLKERFFHAS